MGKYFYSFVIVSLSILLTMVVALESCKKDSGSDSGDPSKPTATTYPASSVGPKWAILYGKVNGHGLTTLVSFEFDTTTAFANTISADPDTLTESSLQNVMAVLTGLTSGTTYHYRVKAVNSMGTVYGGDSTFTTSIFRSGNIVFNPDLTYGTVNDYEGNTYKTIQIGNQTWMAENLRSIMLNDGAEIPFTISYSDWSESSTPGYCWYDNDSLSLGGLYNWYAVNTGKLCPDGWHVPDNEDWTIMFDYLGGAAVAGNKLKESGVTHWTSPNSSANNESGFTALPAGYRNAIGAFNDVTRKSYWWSATENTSSEAYYNSLSYSYSNVDRGSSNKKNGFSIRCVKDN